MSQILDTPIQVVHNGATTSYLISSKHRGKAADDISIWSINYAEELNCFTVTYQNTWHNGATGWGIIPAGNKKLVVLGYNLKNSELVIAKFLGYQNQWHGYPADVRNKPNDKPMPAILQHWYNGGHISKSQMVRIKQGQI